MSEERIGKYFGRPGQEREKAAREFSERLTDPVFQFRAGQQLVWVSWEKKKEREKDGQRVVR